MTKPPSKRGSSRGKNTPGQKASGPKPAKAGGKGGKGAPRGASGKPAGKRPPWMPDLPAQPAAKGSGRKPAAARAPAHQPAHDPHAQREAQRYAQPIASREMILAVLAASDGPMDTDALAQKLALTAPDRFEALEKRLRAMLRDGQLLQNRRGGFVPAARADLVPGTVIANPDGYGFLRPEAGGDDLFLPPFEMRKVSHGDRVLASVTGMDRRGRGEASIVEVLELRLTRLLGRYTEEVGIGYVVPDDKRIQRNVMIPQAERNEARAGQLVVVEITTPQDAHRHTSLHMIRTRNARRSAMRNPSPAAR